jgi:hypothetical protein
LSPLRRSGIGTTPVFSTSLPSKLLNSVKPMMTGTPLASAAFT